MRHRILGIIVLCLTPAASVSVAQDMDEQELQHRLLADIGVTEAELMQFGINLAGIIEPYGQYAHEYEDRIINASEKYVEVIGDFFDNLLQPMIGDIRTEATNFFSEDQYAKMMTLGYQVAENFPEAISFFNNIPCGDMAQLFLLPDVISLTEDQLVDLVAMQKEVITEIVGIEIVTNEENAELSAERDALLQELKNAETEEEKDVIQEKLSKVTFQRLTLMRDRVIQTQAKQKVKLDTLLTAEQIAKLAQIKQGLPDYLQDALAEMTKAQTDDNAESPAAWRPGINSWVPGQGAPKDLENYPREAPRVREPRGERRFPGSE